MNKEAMLRDLHDRASRGASLSVSEQAQLQAWYALGDTEDEKLLAGPVSSDKTAELRMQVQTAVKQLVSATQHIQLLTDQNDALRREIALLQRELSRAPTTQSA